MKCLLQLLCLRRNWIWTSNFQHYPNFLRHTQKISVLSRSSSVTYVGLHNLLLKKIKGFQLSDLLYSSAWPKWITFLKTVKIQMGWKRFYSWVWQAAPWRISICLFPLYILFISTWHIFSFCQDAALKENFLSSEKLKYKNSVKQFLSVWDVYGCTYPPPKGQVFLSLSFTCHNFFPTFKHKNIETKWGNFYTHSSNWAH